MKFSTEVQLPNYPFGINYESTIFSIGSCFSDHVGNRLKRLKFNSLSNPAGVIFNPISICTLLDMALNQKAPLEERIIHRDGLFFHFDYHSSIYGTSKEELMNKINQVNELIRNQLVQSDICIITLGTAWVYEKDDQVVANCHKIQTKDFKRRLLGLEEMQNAFKALHKDLMAINPDFQLILTVSPIRHWKDGASNNQVSKSLLHIVRHQLCHEFKNAHYFPSYELLMDELRDYRFYKKDLLHPTEIAFEHIWDKFSRALFSQSAKLKSTAINKILIGLEHKVLFPESDSHLKHLIHLRQEILKLQEGDEGILKKEMDLLEKRIHLKKEV